MTPTETAALLRQFMDWRRDKSNWPPSPMQIEKAIDAADEHAGVLMAGREFIGRLFLAPRMRVGAWQQLAVAQVVFDPREQCMGVGQHRHLVEPLRRLGGVKRGVLHVAVEFPGGNAALLNFYETSIHLL